MTECHLVILSVTVLDIGPDLGFTVTATTQVPTLRPFKVDLYTLQYRDDLLDTLNDGIDSVMPSNLA